MGPYSTQINTTRKSILHANTSPSTLRVRPGSCPSVRPVTRLCSLLHCRVHACAARPVVVACDHRIGSLLRLADVAAQSTCYDQLLLLPLIGLALGPFVQLLLSLVVHPIARDTQLSRRGAAIVGTCLCMCIVSCACAAVLSPRANVRRLAMCSSRVRSRSHYHQSRRPRRPAG